MTALILVHQSLPSYKLFLSQTQETGGTITQRTGMTIKHSHHSTLTHSPAKHVWGHIRFFARTIEGSDVGLDNPPVFMLTSTRGFDIPAGAVVLMSSLKHVAATGTADYAAYLVHSPGQLREAYMGGQGVTVLQRSLSYKMAHPIL